VGFAYGITLSLIIFKRVTIFLVTLEEHKGYRRMAFGVIWDSDYPTKFILEVPNLILIVIFHSIIT